VRLDSNVFLGDVNAPNATGTLMENSCSSAVSFGGRSSPDILHDTVIPDAKRLLLVNVLKNLLLFDHCSDLCTYLFSLDDDLLKAVLHRHGICSSELSFDQCQQAIVYHLLSGACVINNEGVDMNSSSRLRGEKSDCRDFAIGFQSAAELADVALDIVVSADARSMSTERLADIVRALGFKETVSMSVLHRRRLYLTFLKKSLRSVVRSNTVLSSKTTNWDMFCSFESLPKGSLVAIAEMHRLPFPSPVTVHQLRSMIMLHISSGSCGLLTSFDSPDNCTKMVSEYAEEKQIPASEVTSADLQVYILTKLMKKLSKGPLRRLLQLHDVEFSPEDSVSKLRRVLKKYITRLKKGKQVEDSHRIMAANFAKSVKEKERSKNVWPQLVSSSLKDKILKHFRELTSKETLSSFTCASCAEKCFNSECYDISADDLNISLLQRPDRGDLDLMLDEDRWLDPNCNGPPLPYNDGPLCDIVLDPNGVTVDAAGKVNLLICKTCMSSLNNDKIPPLSLANRNFLGPVPNELKDLTVVEEAMIARCRAKCWVIQLKDEKNLDLANSQRGMKGHIIIYPQRPSEIAAVLPPSLEDIITPICVIFVGSSPPSQKWLREKAKPLSVRREKVRAALIWLKEHNRLYKDIIINHGMLNQLDDRHILPFHIEHVLPSAASDVLTSRYDASGSIESQVEFPENADTLFQNVVITDVDAHAPSNELRAAAIRHVKKKGGGYLEIPHDPVPVNEFCNPHLFPMIYPTLFPYGLGGFEDRKRQSKLSMKRQVKHFFSLADNRFQEHYSFLFTAFNILQRREVLLRSSLKVSKSNFDKVAGDFASVSLNAVHVVSERVARGDFATANNSDESKVLNLMKEVKLITSQVQGSSASRIAMRNEIRGLMMDKGLPSFYITINPADVFNPLVKFLAGADIDIDKLLPEEVPNYWEQSILVARNPAVAAKFFHIYMQAFITAILGYDPKQINSEGGILGVVKAYYGCVEAQGRGTLHCHMLVWIEDSLNPNEIKDRVVGDNDTDFQKRLLAFLDDTISNSIPSDPDPDLVVPSSVHHPCSVRGIHANLSGQALQDARIKDLHNLVKQCQSHTHSKTCYKYWKGPPDPKECRFDLDDNNVRAESSFNTDTGEMCLRCLDGMVNNFNATILEAMRCNMDIKFIGSGPSAKAILYYITDYITKSQLKTHVAFAALELAICKLGEYDPDSDDYTVRAKRLLQKCAYAMISHQELSAPQVCSYLMGFGDHYTSHQFRHLYWTSFEKFINDEYPSPECYVKLSSPINTDLHSDEASTIEEEVDTQNDDKINEEVDEYEETDVDVAITVSRDGAIVPKASQVADYQLRGDLLDNLCVWDCVAQVEKVYLTKKKKSVSEDDIDIDMITDELAVQEGEPPENVDYMDAYTLLQQVSRIRPKSNFITTHLEAKSHFLRVRTPDKRFIPVPIGPAIPRRDNENARAKYCRLMLILFKPWRHAADLCEVGQTWESSFNEFMEHCPERFKVIMNNMQILHECKDSRDDHFANRRNRYRDGKVSQYSSGSVNSLFDDFTEDDEESNILEHLVLIESCISQKVHTSNDAVQQCLYHLESGGMYSKVSSYLPLVSAESESNSILEVQEHVPVLEQTWRKAYEDRRDQWKHKSVNNKDNLVSDSSQNVSSEIHKIIQDGSAYREASCSTSIVRKPMIRLEVPSIEPDNFVDVTDIIEKFTLNTEQTRAFRIISEHSMQIKPDPLRMYIGGPGGTGKTRVIHALTEFFQRRHQDRRFRLTSYTGVAARNIQGMTLHSALCLNQRSGKHSKLRTHRDIVAMWEGVDYLFVDEVSMIGCNFLLQISETLTEAKGNTSAFGGINIIFCGDFAQLPPVGETRLFAHLNTRSITHAGTKRGQNSIFGKLLWLSVNVVVILHEIKRQTGKENQPFIELLARLREGKSTESDYQLLNTRLIKNVRPDWSSSSWNNAPIIVSENVVKDALNVKAALTFAERTGRKINWYYSTDTIHGKPITDNTLKTHLENLHSGQTSQRLGKIPLVIGMPVMFTQNFDVEGGIVNGSSGVLKSIRYKVDAAGNRHALSCVVHIQDTNDSPLPHLPPHFFAALEDTVDMTFTHPYSKKKCLIKRTQLPILPAFAITAHKSQGKTLSNAVIDLESCRGTEAPYVMLSRVSSLEGLVIVRPFAKSKIMCRQSEDARHEFRRLNLLRLQTIVQTSSSEESQQAKLLLSRIGIYNTHNNETISQPVENLIADEAAARLERLQVNNQQLTHDMLDSSSHTLLMQFSSLHPSTHIHLNSQSEINARPPKRRKIS